MNTPKNISDILKTLDDKQNKIAKNITEQIQKLTFHQMTLIDDLIHRCHALEAIQISLFSALAKIDPSTHQKIVEEINEFLKKNEKQGNIDNSYVNHMKSLADVDVKAEKKVHLRLVPKPSSSEPTNKDHQDL